MTYSMIGFVIPLLFLVPAWVGAVALRKSTSQSGPKVILIGCIVASLGVILSLASLFAVAGVAGPEQILQVVSIISFVSVPLGILVFMIGFALHGLQIGRVVARTAELETIAAAQQEEIARLQSKG
ncbi:MAG: hypothetical protein ACPG4K_11715 [Haloferula sp.]